MASGDNDVLYYFQRMAMLSKVGTGQMLLEYPTPVVWILFVPYLLGFGTYIGYLIVFVAGLLTIDLLFSRQLATIEGRGGTFALLCWTSTVALLGPTSFLRIDLITAVLTGWAALLIARRSDVAAGSLTALGAAIKLWPALLWPALLIGDRRRNWRTTLVFWAVGGALALAALLGGGWARLISPLQWQQNRGLQIESVFASVPMIQRIIDPIAHPVYLSTWQAWEIFGPGVSAWQSVTSITTALGMIFVAVCYIGWLRRPSRTALQATLIMVFVVFLMIATNKTFSPQYLLWIFGPLSVAVGLVEAEPELIRPVRRLTWTVVLLCLLTLVVFPVGYDFLVRVSPLTSIITAALVLRNIVLLVLLGWLGMVIARFCFPARKPGDPSSTVEMPSPSDLVPPA